MNILFISFDYPPLSGGIANLSYNIAKNLPLKDGKLVVFVPALKGDKEFDRQSGLAAYRITNIKVIREVVLFFVMLYFIFKFKIKVIYNLSWYPAGAVSYFISLFTGVAYVIHVHAMDYFEDRRGLFNKLKYNWLRGRVKKLTFDRAKKLIAISNFTRDKLIVRGNDVLKINTVFPGVDCGRFMPGIDAKEVILMHKLENKKILLTVSRLEDYKGHDMVIKALPKLLLKFPDIVYLVVGAGPYERSLQALVGQLNLKSQVIFVGMADDNLLALYYNACDVFIMLSREIYTECKVEGFGIVFLEASACAKPIIAGRSGGIEDAVIDGVTGLLVDPLNPQEIQAAITRILSDTHYACQLGANGLERIKKEFLDWHSIGKKIEEILSEV